MTETKQEPAGVLAFAGLGDLAAREAASIGLTGTRVFRVANYDLAVGLLPANRVAGLRDLRLAEDVFLMLGPPMRMASPKDMAVLDRAFGAHDVLRGLMHKQAIAGRPPRKGVTCNCFVKQDRDGPVRRKAVADRVLKAVTAMFRRWRVADPATVEFWGFLVENRLHLGLRLSDSRMRYRGNEPPPREGALRPTIAAAMLFVADPREGELVVDPMCGTGTLLLEGMARCPAARYLGGDQADDAVTIARERVGRCPIEIRSWDAANLPLEAGSADCIVCNLPFGKEYSTPAANRSLYPALVREWSRVLKPGGRMVVLTSDDATLQSALTASGLCGTRHARVRVLGEWAGIHVAHAKSAMRERQD